MQSSEVNKKSFRNCNAVQTLKNVNNADPGLCLLGQVFIFSYIDKSSFCGKGSCPLRYALKMA
jgi:hypothetical protein